MLAQALLALCAVHVEDQDAGERTRDYTDTRPSPRVQLLRRRGPVEVGLELYEVGFFGAAFYWYWRPSSPVIRCGFSPGRGAHVSASLCRQLGCFILTVGTPFVAFGGSENRNPPESWPGGFTFATDLGHAEAALCRCKGRDMLAGITKTLV